MGRKDLVTELSQNQIYSHGIFGCFGEPGHYVQETKGIISRNYFWSPLFSETEYSSLFEGETGLREFRARVWGERIFDLEYISPMGRRFEPETKQKLQRAGLFGGYKLKLIYNDRLGDKRPGSHTDYILIIPSDKVGEIVPPIQEDVSVMIDTFRNVFSNYDRSNGDLIIDSSNPGKMESVI